MEAAGAEPLPGAAPGPEVWPRPPDPAWAPRPITAQHRPDSPTFYSCASSGRISSDKIWGIWLERTLTQAHSFRHSNEMSLTPQPPAQSSSEIRKCRTWWLIPKEGGFHSLQEGADIQSCFCGFPTKRPWDGGLPYLGVSVSSSVKGHLPHIHRRLQERVPHSSPVSGMQDSHPMWPAALTLSWPCCQRLTPGGRPIGQRLVTPVHCRPLPPSRHTSSSNTVSLAERPTGYHPPQSSPSIPTATLIQAPSRSHSSNLPAGLAP